MKVILLGATGMVGQGVLRECLLDPEVETVLAIGRSATVQQYEKLHEIVLNDLSDLSSAEGRLSGYDACFFCLGVSSAGMSEADYTHLTFDLTMAWAKRLARINPAMTFLYVSGAGDRREGDVGAGQRSHASHARARRNGSWSRAT